MILTLVLVGQVVSPVPISGSPVSTQYRIKFEIPLAVGGIVGAGIAFGLTISVKAESNRLRQLPVNKEKKLEVTNQNPIPNTQLPITEQLEFYNWDDLEDEAVGILIAGNSGSAKTSLACWLAGQLTKCKPAQVLALDPHANRNPLWGQLGIKVFSDFNLIERQLELLEKLLDKRRSPNYKESEDDRLIVFTDEIGACIKNFENPSRVERTLERLGSEGRKYDIMLIAMNQSSNTDDVGISAQNRNNFVLILTGASALNFAENKWKQGDRRNKFLQSQAYPCIVTGAVQATIAKHPTHSTYGTFKKKGNPPIGIEPIQQLPLVILLADDSQLKLSAEAEKLLKWFEKKTVLPESKFGIRTIQQSRPLGHKSHKTENIQPVINELVGNSLVKKDSQGNYQIVKGC